MAPAGLLGEYLVVFRNWYNKTDFEPQHNCIFEEYNFDTMQKRLHKVVDKTTTRFTVEDMTCRTFSSASFLTYVCFAAAALNSC